MKRSRVIGTTAVALAAMVTSSLYMTHPAKGSDHQDTFNLASSVGHNTTADITDVYVFPSPSNPANVVLAMDTAPLVGAGMGTTVNFDPTLMWQFKISHSASGVEDQVIQFTATGTGAAQVIHVYGPAAPAEAASTVNKLVTETAEIPYNPSTSQSAVTINGNAVNVFAGPRADPFAFDLFSFFTFLGDRNWGTHTSQSSAGSGTPFSNGDSASNIAALTPAYDKTQPATTPSFNGFASGSMSNATSGASSGYACATNVATNTLADLGGGFNVESFVIEVPKALLEPNGVSVIHVWATVGSSTTSS